MEDKKCELSLFGEGTGEKMIGGAWEGVKAVGKLALVGIGLGLGLGAVNAATSN